MRKMGVMKKKKKEESSGGENQGKGSQWRTTLTQYSHKHLYSLITTEFSLVVLESYNERSQAQYL